MPDETVVLLAELADWNAMLKQLEELLATLDERIEDAKDSLGGVPEVYPTESTVCAAGDVS